MTTAFQSEQYYTGDEWEIILNDFKYTEPGNYLETQEKYVNAMEACDRHNIPLNIDGYTSPENGCYKCEKPMHYTELDKLAERGLPADTCLRCHHNDECPTCCGAGVVGTGRYIRSWDWTEPPEELEKTCPDCNGCGDYDSYCVVSGI